jgi:hypothetical protein
VVDTHDSSAASSGEQQNPKDGREKLRRRAQKRRKQKLRFDEMIMILMSMPSFINKEVMPLSSLAQRVSSCSWKST